MPAFAHTRLSPMPFAAAAACLALTGGAPAVAAPYTLRIDGSFSVTSTSNAVHEQFAQMVWGAACPVASLCWTNGRIASVHLEVDYDDTLTLTPFNATQSYFAHETVSALRVTLGNVQLDTTGLTALSKIDFGLRDNSDVPSLPDGDGYALALAQQATRVGGVYSLPGALPLVSPNGLYAFAFNSTAATGIALPVLEMRAYKTSDYTLAGASPTGRLTVTGSSVQAGGSGGGLPPSSGGTVPEPGSLLLAGLALAAAAGARRPSDDRKDGATGPARLSRRAAPRPRQPMPKSRRR